MVYLLMKNISLLIKIKSKNYYRMRLIKYIFLFIVFVSCDKIPDKIIDSPADDFHITDLNVPENLVLIPSEGKVSLSFNIQVDNPSAISKVFTDIYLKENQEQVFSDLALYDNGDKNNSGDLKANDGIYSTKVLFDTTQNSGEYYIDFFVETINSSVKKVAVRKFNYDNGENNLPPVISSLSIPDSIDRGVSFIFTVRASDPNGLSQIKKVYFQLFRPDGTQVLGANNDPNILMVDDGNFDVFGDLIANDGIFSFKNSFATTAQTGKWVFRFRAQDLSNALSNEIVHEMLVR